MFGLRDEHVCIQINELKIDSVRSFIWGEERKWKRYTQLHNIKEKLFIAMWFSCLFVVVGEFFSHRHGKFSPAYVKNEHV